MDHIIQALELAKAKSKARQAPPGPRLVTSQPPVSAKETQQAVRDIELSLDHLEGKRIVAHNAVHPGTKAFDLLRTQVLQAMDANGWRILAITSPTPACGKTFTAANLALSIARQPESSVLLVDLDLQKPQVGQRLGLDAANGLRSLLGGRTQLDDAISRVSVDGLRLGILACERPSSRASDWTGSPQMATVLRELRMHPSIKTVLLDLPPVLSGDQALAILPHVDCVLMVAAAGVTTATELKEAADYLKSTPVVRVAFNRASEVRKLYYY